MSEKEREMSELKPDEVGLNLMIGSLLESLGHSHALIRDAILEGKQPIVVAIDCDSRAALGIDRDAATRITMKITFEKADVRE